MQRDKGEIAVEAAVLFKKDGTVTPLSFRWTDGEVYKIDKVIDVRRGSSMKAQGGGVRYKIAVKGSGDNYLFRFGDRWFFSAEPGDALPALQTRRNEAPEEAVLDSRYDNPYKVSVDVRATCFPDGIVEPAAFVWENGTEYPVDVILRSERGVSLRAGITGLRYDVKSMGRAVSLYRDGNLWFMERAGDGQVLDVHGGRM